MTNPYVGRPTSELRAIHLTLPLPPTANKYYRRVGRRTLISADGRAFKKHCGILAAGQIAEPLTGPVEITGTIYMARRGCDLDNRIKPLLDGIEGHAFANDGQVVRLDLRKALDHGNPRVEITITVEGS